MAEKPAITSENFENAMEALGLDWAGVEKIAVAVSGGPDSMALCALLKAWGQGRGIHVHALSVDHGLRPEAAQEVERVGQWLEDWPEFTHQALRWDNPSKSAIQEEARKARYDLMAAYCREQTIAHLFLGHHIDDQAETVLFRLAKGSGLDGLTGMRALQNFDENLTLVRPLLSVPKDELRSFCDAADLSYLDDPSNEDDRFARIRIRKSREVLAKEGLSSKRLSITAKRLSRARKALDSLAEKAYKEAILENDTKCIVFKLKILENQPEEIILRCVLKALEKFRPEADYAPRMEKVEALLDDLISSRGGGNFRKRTLGGVIFERDGGAETLIMTKE